MLPKRETMSISIDSILFIVFAFKKVCCFQLFKFIIKRVRVLNKGWTIKWMNKVDVVWHTC